MRRLVVLVVFAAVATTALALASAMAAPDPAPVVEQIGDVQTVTRAKSRASQAMWGI